jgi:hypothetical protein
VPVKRAVAIGVFLALALAAPAGAAVQGPTVLDFEDQTVGDHVGIGASPGAVYAGRNDVVITDSDSCGQIATPGGSLGPKYVFDSCPPFRLTFTSPQAEVSVFARAGVNGTAGSAPDLSAVALDANGAPVAQTTVTGAVDWRPIVLTSPDGAAKIARVELRTTRFRLDVDGVGFSPTPQPDTDITSGPSGTVANGDATFTFAGNQDGMTFRCRLDGGPESACSSPATFANLPDGQHSFTVAGVDRWGSADASPASRTWTVSRPLTDRDRDGVLDGADNCPDAANPGQGDADGDGVGDACELFTSGNDPIQAGIDTKVRLVSGEVFIKLPPGASASAFTADLRAPFQDSGFLPLKGVATVPMGSTIDTRAGVIALTAAVNGQRALSKRQLRRQARFSAGIFAIRQRRYLKGLRKKKIPPRAELTSAPGAEAPCRGSSGPAKGTRVRSLVTTAKGVFRTVGAAATTAPAKGTATYNTTDRCDGTVTSVGRGRVAVIAKKSGKRTVVRAGRSFIVRARLFAARKGRG